MSGRKGTTSTTSAVRMMSASIRRPKYPLRTPSTVPSSVPTVAASAPMASETRAPQMSSDRMSWPMSFVPRRCARLGASNGRPLVTRGSYGATIGARTAVTTITPSRTRPLVPTRPRPSP